MSARTTRTAIGGALAGAALAFGACGDEEPRTNELRPPAPILLNAAVTPAGVTASPPRFGAGPITIVVTNLTGSSQQVTLESDAPGEAGAIRQTTSPINPKDTATLKAEVVPGRYRLSVAGDEVAAARLTVGRERPSSQNDLMLP